MKPGIIRGGSLNPRKISIEVQNRKTQQPISNFDAYHNSEYHPVEFDVIDRMVGI